MRKFSVLFKGMSTVNSVKTPPEEDFYAILGVAKNASEQEIKNAYRKLALKCKFFGIELCVWFSIFRSSGPKPEQSWSSRDIQKGKPESNRFWMYVV